MNPKKLNLPLYRDARFTDREVVALLTPAWRKIFWRYADWEAFDRARRILRDGNGQVEAESILDELHKRNRRG